jgi:hypothetical protein
MKKIKLEEIEETENILAVWFFCVKSHHYFIYILIQKFLIFTEFVRPKW